MRSTRYTILVANRETGVVRRFTLPLKPVLLTMLAITAIPMLVGLGARWSAGAEIQSVRHANESLRLENESYRQATGELATQISALQTAVDQLGNDASLDPETRRAIQNLPKNLRDRAMGGGGSMAANQPAETIGVLRGVLNVIETQISGVRGGR